jgi:hypothetical protein
MERYLIHLKNEKHIPINSREILYRSRDLISGMNAHIRLTRIATTFIEFDVAIETKDVDTLVDKLSSIGDLDNVRHVVEEEIEMDQGIKDGIFILIANDFGNVMKPLKVFGNNALVVKRNWFKGLYL